MHVVMVHGFLDTGGLFSEMAARLEERGHACHAPTFYPRDGGLGLSDLSGKLGTYVDTHVPAGAPMALVGFSMGALVARHYLQARGGASRAQAFFSIAGPHGGTPMAYLYPRSGTRQMAPGSPFLRELAGGGEALATLPVFTYRTPFDLMVFPAATTRIAGARETVIHALFHSKLPSDPRLLAHVGAALSSIGAAST
jgi:triacylglycerol lipase